MLVFDIGYNHGKFSSVWKSKAKVVAVEANPNLIKFDPGVVLLNFAVCDKDDSFIDFYISNADTISTTSLDWIEKSRFTGQYRWFQPIKVKTITLDSLISQYGVPDFLKIDVEGSEYEVLKGLSQTVPLLCFEWAEESLPKIQDSINRLKELGFTKFNYLYADSYDAIPDEWFPWDDLDFFSNLDPNRKEKWGMIFAKL